MCRVLECLAAVSTPGSSEASRSRAERSTVASADPRDLRAEPRDLRQSSDLPGAAGRGVRATQARVERLMRENGITPPRKKKFRVTTDSNHPNPWRPTCWIVISRVRRRIGAGSSDITYVWTGEGWLYLAVVLDLFSRRVVGWSMDSTLDPRRWCSTRCTWPCTDRSPGPGLIHHSDRGRQYASDDYQKVLDATRHRLQHEPQGRLLGQRRRRELLRHAEARTDLTAITSAHVAEATPGDLRVHRGVLQPATATFVPRLPAVRSEFERSMRAAA